MKESLTLLNFECELENLDSSARTPGDYEVILPEFLGEDFGQVIDADALIRFAVIRKHNRIVYLPLPTARQPRCAVPGSQAVALRQKLGEELFGVSETDMSKIFPSLRNSAWSMDHHLFRRARKTLRGITGDRIVNAGTDAKKEVGVLQRKINSAGSHGAWPSDKELLVIGKKIGCKPRRHNGGAKKVCQSAILRLCMGKADAISRQQYRPLGSVEKTDNLANLISQSRLVDRNAFFPGLKPSILSKSMVAACTSSGISIQTGPGRPVVAI